VIRLPSDPNESSKKAAELSRARPPDKPPVEEAHLNNRVSAARAACKYDADKAEASFIEYRSLKQQVDRNENLRSDPSFVKRLNTAWARFEREFGN
jgi:hypothetical protein